MAELNIGEFDQSVVGLMGKIRKENTHNPKDYFLREGPSRGFRFCPRLGMFESMISLGINSSHV